MCKLFIATGSISKQQTLKLIERAASLFSRTQKDGFGFVAYGSSGTVATGHYLEPANYPGFNVSLPEWIECNRIESGRIPENVTALVCHGRTATSKVVIANVHPFNNKHLFLSHNGVLSWIGSGPEPKAKHSCDSEQFLNWFSTLKAPFNETKANWSGYGVFGILNTRSKTLTVAKCGNGKLSYSATDTCHLWSTDSADVESLGKVLANNATRPLAMRAKTLCRFDISKRKPRLLSVDNWEGFGSVSHKGDDWFRSMGQTSSSRRTVWSAATTTTDSFPDWEPATATTTGAL